MTALGGWLQENDEVLLSGGRGGERKEQWHCKWGEVRALSACTEVGGIWGKQISKSKRVQQSNPPITLPIKLCLFSSPN